MKRKVGGGAYVTGSGTHLGDFLAKKPAERFDVDGGTCRTRPRPSRSSSMRLHHEPLATTNVRTAMAIRKKLQNNTASDAYGIMKCISYFTLFEAVTIKLKRHKKITVCTSCITLTFRKRGICTPPPTSTVRGAHGVYRLMCYKSKRPLHSVIIPGMVPGNSPGNLEFPRK